MYNVPTDKTPEFQDIQYQFARAIRNPNGAVPPHGVAEKRMRAYQELFFNNIYSFLRNAYPVLTQLLGESSMQAKAREFMIEHRCESPYFNEIAAEFLQFLEQRYQPRRDDPGFLLELAHYEWVELKLSIAMDEAPIQRPVHDLRILDSQARLSPLAMPLCYRYAVHRIGRHYQPGEPEATPTYLVVYRDRDDKVVFLELNPVSARLLQLIQEQPERILRAHIEQIIRELHSPQPAQIFAHGQQLLEDLQRRSVLQLIPPA